MSERTEWLAGLKPGDDAAVIMPGQGAQYPPAQISAVKPGEILARVGALLWTFSAQGAEHPLTVPRRLEPLTPELADRAEAWQLAEWLEAHKWHALPLDKLREVVGVA